jgi:hypothetical protein
LLTLWLLLLLLRSSSESRSHAHVTTLNRRVWCYPTNPRQTIKFRELVVT